MCVCLCECYVHMRMLCAHVHVRVCRSQRRVSGLLTLELQAVVQVPDLGACRQLNSCPLEEQEAIFSAPYVSCL